MSASWELSPLAYAELDSILEYVALESRSLPTVRKVQSDFFDAFEQLADAPRIGHLKHELTGDGVRWWRVHDYLVLYDPETKPLRVIRILHGARDLRCLLED